MSDASSSSDEPRRDRDDDPSSRDAQDTEAILTRRRRFITAALGSLALATSAACSAPQPCLDVAPPDRPNSDATETSVPRDVSEGDAQEDARPMPCLSPALDSGVTTDAAADVDDDDAAPAPCLRIVPMDGGSAEQDANDDAAPAPCLRIVPMDGGSDP